MTLATGTRLGSYEILSALGAGGMGEVYRARDLRLERQVAIKVLPESLFGDADLVARFEREAKALAALNHPGIAAIHAFEEVGGRHLLVQELLEGETLRQVLASGKVPLRKALDHAVQIARALAAAHERGVVHRDLKPENLFVTGDGRVKVLDFGLAKITRPEAASGTNLPTASHATQPGMVMGTLGYMSPEQVRGLPADARSDIFSFGAVLYEMLSGRKAFSGDSAADTMSAILKEDPPDLAITNQAFPPGLERIVRHCLEKRPEQRFHSAHDLAFDLEALSLPSGPRAVTLAAPTRAFPWRAAAAAVGLLALGLLAGRFVWPRPSAAPPTYRRLTFRRGTVWSGFFAPDGQAIAYAATWDGTLTPKLYTTRAENPESLALPLPEKTLLSISKSGEMLLLDHLTMTKGYSVTGRLSQAPLSGSAARDLMDDVGDADWAPDGTRYAVVKRSGGRYRLEYPAGKVLYESSGWINYPRVSPSGDAVAFTDHRFLEDDRGAVAIVDMGGKKTTLADGWESVQGLAWRGNDAVWFTASGNGSVRVLYEVTRKGRQRAVAASPTGMRLQDITQDGRVLFVQESTRLDAVALVPGETRERVLTAFDWAYNPVLAADGKSAVFTEQGPQAGAGYAVFQRRLDGAPAVRLGEGMACAVSPDGRWVLAVQVRSTPAQLALLPTGVGEARTLTKDAIDHSDGWFFPDGKRVLVVGHEPGKPERGFVQDLDGGPARAVTPEGTVPRLLAHDGSAAVVTTPDGRLALLPLDGGAARPITGTEPGDEPRGWSQDGRVLFVSTMERSFPLRVFRIEVESGRREPWREFTPADPDGVTHLYATSVSADGKTVLFNARRDLSTLFLAEGLR